MTTPTNYKSRNSSPINWTSCKRLILDIASEERKHLPECYQATRVSEESVRPKLEAHIRAFCRTLVKSTNKGKTIS
jgi:hypothetical protein